MKLCIGTVQFGIDYGVRNGKRTSVEDAIGILDFATQNGVDAIDTATAYGMAEEVVGKFIARKTIPRDAIQIVSKFGMDIFAGWNESEYPKVLRAAAEKSIERLQSAYLDAFICHVPSAVDNDAVIAAMLELRDSGIVRHIGFSLYETTEAISCIDSSSADFIQVPFSILDQRMKSSGVFKKALSRGVDVHARSVFVQGLLLMPIDSVPPYLAATRPYIEELEALCVANGITRRAMALAYVKVESGISHLVFGVRRMSQLREILDDFMRDVPVDMVNYVATRFENAPADIFMPNKWRR